MKETFFTHDRSFYRSLFSMLIVVAMQNVIAYSVNMADNIMLGAYSQEALSGAAVVNQVFFIVQQATIAIGDGLIVIMSLVMVGMSYQMPVAGGVLKGSGDAKFSMKLNLISTWLIVTPLSFAAAFLWKWPIAAVVMCLQSDQIFKCLPVFLRFRSYKWIHKLTR